MDSSADLSSLEARILEVREKARLKGSDLINRFAASARKVGCTIFDAKDFQEAGRFIGELAKSKSAPQILASSNHLMDLLRPTCATEGSDNSISGPEPGKLLSGDIGVSEAVLGIAETGSILIHLDEVDPRLVTMLPPVFVAILQKNELVESLEDGLLITRHRILSLQSQGKPSYLTWVTGPSRTADIERVLTIGVHGPKEMFIILI